MFGTQVKLLQRQLPLFTTAQYFCRVAACTATLSQPVRGLMCQQPSELQLGVAAK